MEDSRIAGVRDVLIPILLVLVVVLVLDPSFAMACFEYEDRFAEDEDD